MRKIRTEFLREGMVIARPVFDARGRLLLAEGIVLNETFIKRLSEMGIGSLYIDDGVFAGSLEVNEILSQKMRLRSVKLMKETFHSVKHRGWIDTKAIGKTIEEVIEEVMTGYGALVNYYDIRTYDDHTFNHSVDVCVFSLLAGIALGFSREKLKELGIGALLHDIGKVRIPKCILNKPGPLTAEEMVLVMRHPADGFDILRRHHDIPLLSAHVALEHQERISGKGYPRGLTGKEIHEYAKIVMVADVFDALVSDRPYRKAYPVAEAIDYIQSLAGEDFGEEYVRALFSNISPYPVGAVVLLNTGEVAQVVSTNKNAPNRPVVRVHFNRKKEYVSCPFELDLSRELSRSIVRILAEEDISDLLETVVHRKARALYEDKNPHFPTRRFAEHPSRPFESSAGKKK
ncbi:MAG: HD-GYP domain-containing protein [Thermacetogeniaceae bacterium]